MSREEYVPSERIVDRAVSLWIDALRAPQYNNGGGASGFMASALASMLPKNNDEETLVRFGTELKKLLMEGQVRQYGNSESYTHFETYLTVDYGPDDTLSTAAEAAGLKMQFPWKTSMHLWTDHVQFSMGYGNRGLYHYPASGGRWVTTTLSGSEEHVKAMVEFAEMAYANSGESCGFLRIE